jgi:hypothetical protein
MNYRKMADDSEPRSWSILDDLEEEEIEALEDQDDNDREQEEIDEKIRRNSKH